MLRRISVALLLSVELLVLSSCYIYVEDVLTRSNNSHYKEQRHGVFVKCSFLNYFRYQIKIVYESIDWIHLAEDRENWRLL
jgi:hypothetical protein